MQRDEYYMQRCFDIAQFGAGTVSPNPMVGAVLVYDGKIIGEGYTSPYGGPHAEVNAIRSVEDQYAGESSFLLANSTLYVSLEPCAHYGKTPPCADLVVEKQIPKVVIGCVDPFAKVNGEGVRRLQNAGVNVVVGVLEDQAKWVNRRFFTKLDKHRPYIVLKWAETQDGFIAPEGNEPYWISNAASKQLVHKWRAEEDAILVGKRTAILDNPSLTTREWSGKNPKRILIDKNLEVPASHAIFSDDAETIVFNDIRSEWMAMKKWIALENFDLYLPQQIVYQLFLMDVQSLLIEGGAYTLQRFIDAGLWDEARIFTSNKIVGQGVGAPKIQGAIMEQMNVSTDSLRILVNK